MTSGVSFVLGVLGFARGIADSHILSPRLTRLTVIALTVMAASVVPLGAVQFYLQGAAGIAALWPLSYEMWKHPEARPELGHDRSRRPDGTFLPGATPAFATATTPANSPRVQSRGCRLAAGSIRRLS